MIIVVDNNSTDDTVLILKDKYPDITLLALKKNLGFGRGNNIGIRNAYKYGAEHVLLLNQDAYVNSKTVDKISTLLPAIQKA